MSDLYLPLRSVHMTCPALSILGTIEPDTVARALHGGVHGGPHGVGEAMAARVNAPGTTFTDSPQRTYGRRSTCAGHAASTKTG